MLRCIETNKPCPASNKLCKICKLDFCKETINMLEIQERNVRKEKIEKLNKLLPEQCRNCSFLEIIDLDNKKVKCAYLVKNECLIGANMKQCKSKEEPEENITIGKRKLQKVILINFIVQLTGKY